MEDFIVDKDKEIREQTLMMEEAHYFHTINAFVELIVLYGRDKVMGDLQTTMGWWKC
jgi:hypothetical protein